MSKTYKKRRRKHPGRFGRRFTREDRHHLVAKAIGGTDAAENIIILDRRIHELLHMVFGTMHPSQYLPYIKRNPSVACYRMVRGVARTFGTEVVEAALKEATS
jgi:hypothetical protein